MTFYTEYVFLVDRRLASTILLVLTSSNFLIAEVCKVEEWKR
jgi:hypothetical protein